MAKMKKMKTVVETISKIGLLTKDNASRQGATPLESLDTLSLFFLSKCEDDGDKPTDFTIIDGEVVGIKTDLAKRIEEFMTERPAGKLWNPVLGAPIVEKATEEEKILAGDQREWGWERLKALPTDYKLVIRRQITTGEDTDTTESKTESLKVELSKSDLLSGYTIATGSTDENPRGDEIKFVGRVASSRQMLLRLGGIAYLEKTSLSYMPEIEFVVKDYENDVERFLDNVRENNGKESAQRKLTALDQFEIGLRAYEDHGFSIGDLRTKKICGKPGMAQKVQGAIRLLNAFPSSRAAILKEIRRPDNRFKSTNKEVMREMLEEEDLTAADVVAYFNNPKGDKPSRSNMMSKKDIKSEHSDSSNPVVKEILGAVVDNNTSALTAFRKAADLWAVFYGLVQDKANHDRLRDAFSLIEKGYDFDVVADSEADDEEAVADEAAVEEALS